MEKNTVCFSEYFLTKKSWKILNVEMLNQKIYYFWRFWFHLINILLWEIHGNFLRQQWSTTTFSSGKFTEIFYANNGLRVLAICSSILEWGKIRWNLNVYFFCYAELNICLYICRQSVPLKWIICSHSLSVFLLGFCLISHCSRRFLGVSNEPCLLVSVSLFPSPLKLGVLRWPASADRVRQK